MGGGTVVAKARLLLLGLDPDLVDYSKSPVPGLDMTASWSVQACASCECIGKHRFRSIAFIDDAQRLHDVAERFKLCLIRLYGRSDFCRVSCRLTSCCLRN
jgi:hypothetical protein